MEEMIKKALGVGEALLLPQQMVLLPQQMVGQTQSTSDDMKVIMQILDNHSPDANCYVNEKDVLNKVKDILIMANPTFGSLDSNTPKVPIEKVVSEELVRTIHKILSELSCNCFGGGDMQLTTAAVLYTVVKVFDTLVKYSWEDKLVIVLLAVAVNYGEFCLSRQLDAAHPLAKYVVQLKSLFKIPAQETLFCNILKGAIATAESIIKLKELSFQYPQHISDDKPPLSYAEIKIDVYWAIKGIVACNKYLSIGLMNMSDENMGFIAKACMGTLGERCQNLRNICDRCDKLIVEKENEKDYYRLKEHMKNDNNNSMGIFIELIQKNDLEPLFITRDNKEIKVGFDQLKSNTVILFFSYFDIPDEEIEKIEQQVWTTTQRPYEIVWLPILYGQGISNEITKVIKRKAGLMPWYSLHYSLTLHSSVVKYIKKHCKLENKPLMIAFNKHGNVVSHNVYDMIMTHGSEAYPFDDQREKELWKAFKWGLGFYIDAERVEEGKLTLLYGGDDLTWIRELISAMKGVVQEEIMLIYVGKKHRKTIKDEDLSECWDDQKIMQFWARMQGMLYSKMKFGVSIDTDTTLKDVLTLLGSEGSGERWAIIGSGSEHMFSFKGETIKEWLDQLKREKGQLKIQDLISELVKFKPPPRKKHCNHILVTSTNGITQENMVCVDCHCLMKMTVIYECCKNE